MDKFDDIYSHSSRHQQLDDSDTQSDHEDQYESKSRKEIKKTNNIIQ